MGTKRQNLHLYYDMANVLMLADTHNLRLVLNFPLKSMNRESTMYKIVVVPARVWETVCSSSLWHITIWQPDFNKITQTQI